MGETDYHTLAIMLLREVLEDFFAQAGRADVHVASTMVMYYQQGVPSSRRDPDVLVTLGVGNHQRRSFRVWEEGKVPDVLFEIASESTWREDVGAKRQLYEQLGIREYFLFDPEGLYLNPPLQGFRLSPAGSYVSIQPGQGGALESLALGLLLVPQGNVLRVADLQTGQLFPTRAERAEQAEERAEQAEAEVERLRQLLQDRNGTGPGPST